MERKLVLDKLNDVEYQQTNEDEIKKENVEEYEFDTVSCDEWILVNRLENNTISAVEEKIVSFDYIFTRNSLCRHL
ncbi:unnamed protein product [Caenorhabditis bovis]|uniref:Uncharacterized protein n=1 Tax=Caenorhabditis bovis TaxID=2654633 RepID=A0A8S1EFN3_9PELO|nr:unnamed protein product [Caenorhabditis bovis]